MEMDLSVKWLATIIIMGLVQFGVFWEQFRQVGADISEIKAAMREGLLSVQAANIKDAQQDARLYELERRMSSREARH
jgi:hypothetical protein